MQHTTGLFARLTGVVRARPGISRVELAEVTALSPATISRAVQELLDVQCLVEAARGETPSGRPRTGLVVNPRYAYAVALDIKVQGAVVAIVDFAGQIVDRRRLTIPMDPVAQAMQQLRDALNAMVASHQHETPKLAGIGIAISGTWNTAQHALVFSPTLPGWHGINLMQVFQQVPGTAVIIDNDSRAAAMAELTVGAGRRLDDFLYVYGDFGIGSALVHQRRLIRGQDNLGGGLGHALVSVEPDAPVCSGCGRPGCLGALLNHDLIAQQIAHGVSSERTLQTMAEYLSVPITNVLNQVCPQALILGGDLFLTYPEFYPLVVQACRQRLLQHIVHRVGFVRAEKDPDAPVVGMASRVFAREVGRDASGVASAVLSPT